MTDEPDQIIKTQVEQVSRVAELLNTMESREMVAEQLGWTLEALDKFESDNANLFTMAREIIESIEEPEPPPTDIEPSLAELPDEPPSIQDVALAVERADRNLKRGLQAIGLTEREAEEAEALQQFNKNHFADSMDMVSSNVLRTALKLAVQQRILEGRLEFVRAQISEYGGFASEERDNWVKEEKMLTYQYIEIGELVKNIQDTWYKGAAVMAIIRVKMKGGGNVGFNTQRSNKPGFRPTITVAQ